MRANLLFVINGLGLGNSTRCHAVLDILSKHYDVDICVSNNSHKYFNTRKDLFRNLYVINGFQYASGSLLNNILSIKRNFDFIDKIVSNNDYSAVLVDSEYVAPFVALKNRIKVISINNSSNGFERFELRLIKKSFKHFFVELFDHLYQKIFANYVVVPTFEPNSIIGEKHSKFPPIVRKGLTKKSSCLDVKNVLILFSGSALFSVSDELYEIVLNHPEIHFICVGDVKWSMDNFKSYDKFTDTIHLINISDLIICNAGFSSLSEVIYSRTPSWIVPISGHFEQNTNAACFDRNNWALITDKIDHPSFFRLLRNRSLYFDKMSLVSFEEDAAQLVGNFILDKI